MLTELRDKVAVITGGGSGIGASLARACAAEGMRVVVADIDRARAEAVTAALGVDALACAVDVSSPDDVEAFAAAVEARFGAPDLLCNNAGVSPFGQLWDFAPLDWNWLLGVNLIGVANGIRSFVPRMIAAGKGGHIVNTASSAALLPDARLGAYGATKAAVLGLSDSLRLDLAPHGIGVSVLCPGGVDTNITQTLARRSSSDPQADLTADLQAFMAHIDPAQAVSISPDQVAALVLRGVRADRPYIVTAPGLKDAIARRYASILAAFDEAREADATLP